MSHGECDDWWDFFDCPLWVPRYLNELNVIDMDKAIGNKQKMDELRKTVDFHYSIMKKWEGKYLYEGSPSLNAVKL